MSNVDRGGRSFADRLNRLFETIRPEGSKHEYTNVEVAQAVGLTPTYVGKLRNGQSANPSAHLVRKLERFFGLTEPYLYSDDPDVVDNVERQLTMFRVLHDTGVLPIAARAAEIHTADGRALLSAAIEHIIRGESQQPS